MASVPASTHGRQLPVRSDTVSAVHMEHRYVAALAMPESARPLIARARMVYTVSTRNAVPTWTGPACSCPCLCNGSSR